MTRGQRRQCRRIRGTPCVVPSSGATSRRHDHRPGGGIFGAAKCSRIVVSRRPAVARRRGDTRRRSGRSPGPTPFRTPSSHHFAASGSGRPRASGAGGRGADPGPGPRGGPSCSPSLVRARRVLGRSREVGACEAEERASRARRTPLGFRFTTTNRGCGSGDRCDCGHSSGRGSHSQQRACSDDGFSIEQRCR